MIRDSENNDANDIIDIYNGLVRNLIHNEIAEFKLDWDEVNRVVDISTVKTKSVEFINVTFTINSDGSCEYI